MANKALFDAASDLEAASITLEDIQNVLTVFGDQLSEWWAGVKRNAPAPLASFDNSFSVVSSLLTVTRRQLHDVITETNDNAKKAYSAYAALKETEPA